MKLRDLLRHIESHGCRKLREGGNHSLRVVLMRPGSVTHHFDAEQRYIELEVVGTKQTGNSTQVDFYGSDDQTMASKGYYMLFAVVDGWPSVASIVLVN
jgi:hypothetical protein